MLFRSTSVLSAILKLCNKIVCSQMILRVLQMLENFRAILFKLKPSVSQEKVSSRDSALD